MNATDERDFYDLLHISWWDRYRSEIDDDLDANGRPKKRGVDTHCNVGPCLCPECRQHSKRHAPACAGHDGNDFECVCPLADRGIL